MKKLLWVFILSCIVSVMTACEYSCHTYYKIINLSQYDIVVEIRDDNQHTTIKAGESQSIYRIMDLCGKGTKPGDRFEENQDKIILKATMEIDGNPVADIIWTRKYWEFTNKQYEAIYTLTITNELLESIRLEEGK